MKKSLVALSIASIIGASVAHAAPEANTFYAGAKAGYSKTTNVGALQQSGIATKAAHKYKRNAVSYGLFAGYQINSYLAVELGLDQFGTLKVNNKATGSQVIKQNSIGAQLTAKGSIPVMDALDIYARAGVAYTHNKYKTTDGGSDKHSNTGLIGAVGAEYALTKDVAMRLEYQYLYQADKLKELTINNVKHTLNKKHKPSIHTVSLGVSYRFGQTGAAKPVAAAKKFAVSSEVLFDFNKATLKASGKQEIVNLHNQIVDLKIANPQVEVQGYADRMGNAEYNLKLSQKRADTVAKALVAEGFNHDSISSVGYGSQNPVTGNSCDAVKGRTALIECLAPDRRVEILVDNAK